MSEQVSEQAKLIDARLTEAINVTEGAVKQQRTKGICVKLAVTVCTASLTVLLGLKVNPELTGIFKNLALVVGAVATVANAYEGFFDHRALWRLSTNTLARLQTVKDEFDYYRAGTAQSDLNSDKLANFFQQAVAIRNDHLEDWKKAHEQNKT